MSRDIFWLSKCHFWDSVILFRKIQSVDPDVQFFWSDSAGLAAGASFCVASDVIALLNLGFFGNVQPHPKMPSTFVVESGYGFYGSSTYRLRFCGNPKKGKDHPTIKEEVINWVLSSGETKPMRLSSQVGSDQHPSLLLYDDRTAEEAMEIADRLVLLESGAITSVSVYENGSFIHLAKIPRET